MSCDKYTSVCLHVHMGGSASFESGTCSFEAVIRTMRDDLVTLKQLIPRNDFMLKIQKEAV